MRAAGAPAGVRRAPSGASTTRGLRAEADEQPLEPRLGAPRPGVTRSGAVGSLLDRLDRVGLGHPAGARAPARARPADRRRRAGTRPVAAVASGGSKRSSSSVAPAIRSTRKRRSAAGQVAVPEQVQAAVLGVHDVRVDVPLGAGVAAVGVVVEVHAPVLGDAPSRSTSSTSGAAGAEVDVEHLVGVDAEHRGQLGHAPGRARRRRRRPGRASTRAPAASRATAWSGVRRWGASKTSA